MPEEMTEKEVQDLAALVSDSLFGNEPKKEEPKKEEPKEETDKAAKEAEEKAAADKAAADKAAADKAEADKKAEDEKAAAAKTPEKKEEPKAPTADQIADKVVEKMAPKPEPKQTPKLSEEDAHTREVFEQMAQDDPEYKKVIQQFDTFVVAEEGYRKQWEKDNPGKKFEPAAEEHKEFYDANEPEYEETDFHRAEVRLEARKVNQEERQKELHQKAVSELSERIKEIPSEVTAELAAATDPELAKVDLKKTTLRAHDPIAEAALRPYIPELTAKVTLIEKVFKPNAGIPFNDKNPLDLEVLQDIYQIEQSILQGPAEGKVNGGRTLVPIEDYNSMSMAERQKHWCVWLDPATIKKGLVKQYAEKSSADLALLRGEATKRAAAAAPKETPKQEEKKSDPPKSDDSSKSFPNTGGGAESSPGNMANDNIDVGFAKIIADKMFH